LKVLDRIERTVDNLSYMLTGRKGRVEGTYEKPVAGLPYIVACALQTLPDGSERIVILHVIHGARNWPPGEWPK
jgi:plasmid stabilization system protein ParE